jgi:hypothetical protein
VHCRKCPIFSFTGRQLAGLKKASLFCETENIALLLRLPVKIKMSEAHIYK